MLVSFVFAILLSFSPFCSCNPTKTRHPKRDSSGLHSFINTAISSPNGTDVSSHFLTKVYTQPRVVSADGLNERGTMGERRILECKSRTAKFHHSHCRRQDESYSIREYIVWCREAAQPSATVTWATDFLPAEAQAMATAQAQHDPSLHGEIGKCAQDEICIDSLYAIGYREPVVLIANCVSKKYFKDLLSPEDLEEDVEVGASTSADLTGKVASVVVTKDDSQTPMQVQEIDLKSGSGGEKSASDQSGKSDAEILQERNCTDCFELKTRKVFDEKTDDLQVELKLVGTGAVAATGVLWLALLSG